ncbi:unnamed protein product [Photorhabdus laumondii subsp. laumondii TTO1]|uniref:Photorhabdus luminescens subsp. laumondii TTO1 complete genome segment 7/17 n=1 Tax=Photorhabdus laumondii subsp. laumondii (strain DSM 15139 / CIP 105565 / TT01) TaxID=243265 RepID=Q7N605_PHOLL|nr:unnamed protein product [Photorhabdus laumondii subsp. laumondii TTO1]
MIIAQFANCILIGQRQLGVCNADIQVRICVISSRDRPKLGLDLIFFCMNIESYTLRYNRNYL